MGEADDRGVHAANSGTRAAAANDIAAIADRSSWVARQRAVVAYIRLSPPFPLNFKSLPARGSPFVSKGSLVAVDEVTFSYGAAPILAGLTLTIFSGQVVAIMGGSGSGKTTLLRLIGGAAAT